VVSNLAQSDILRFHLSFNKAHNFTGVKCGWCSSSTSLTDVSKWLCSFFKAMFPTVNDLWVSKLKKADVPCDSSWILNDSMTLQEWWR
jgi:hypothetical protein